MDDVMVSLFMFEWNDESVDSFITKFIATPREGLCFPENIQPHTTTRDGRGAFKNDVLNYFADTDEGVSVQHSSIVCKDQSSASRFSANLVTLGNEPWVQAILAKGEPLPGKLAKVTVVVRNTPANALPGANALFH